VSVRLFSATRVPARGTVVVVPGLNNRPQAMNPLIGVLRHARFHAVRASLHQTHRDDRPSPDALAGRWVDDVAAAHAAAVAYDARLPVFNLSYSLGAVATLRFLQVTPTAGLAAMVLLAPPLSLTRRARLVRWLTPLGGLGLALPSLAPARVRARSGTPVVEYAALLRLVDDVRLGGQARRLGRVPTRVVLSSADELVSRRGVRAWIERNRLGAWTVESLDVDPPGRTSRHLMVSRASVGDAAWRALTEALVDQFGGTR